jgi:hypothetical protein
VLTVKAPEANNRWREDELNELAFDISAVIPKARQLNLPASAYILSMVLVEVSQQVLEEKPDNIVVETRCDSVGASIPDDCLLSRSI